MSKNLDTEGYMGASGSFVHGFIATLSVIVVSELGDKTFFIAAIGLEDVLCILMQGQCFSKVILPIFFVT